MEERIVLPQAFDGAQAAAARGEILRRLDPAAVEILADGSAVCQVDAIGIGVLVMLQRRLERQGGRLRLCDPSPALQDVLGRVRLQHQFD